MIYHRKEGGQKRSNFTSGGSGIATQHIEVCVRDAGWSLIEMGWREGIPRDSVYLNVKRERVEVSTVGGQGNERGKC